MCPELSSGKIEKIADKKQIIAALNEMKKDVEGNKELESIINMAINFFSKKE